MMSLNHLTELSLKNDKMALQRLKDAAENAKKELSSANETEINLPFITMDATGPKHFVKKITRSKFESLIEDLVDETITKISQVMKDSGLDKDEINEVVMVGGSTRVPLVQEKVKAFFEKDLNKSVNPDEVVAIGAAIQGGVIKGDVKDVLLLDVTPLTLGIETLGGVMTKIVEKGTTIPVKKQQTFSTAEDNQTAVTISVIQGEREFAKDNKSLGQFNLEGIPAAQRGVPQIEVTFDLDANGILNVSAIDKASGKEQKITISGSSGLSDAEIEKMVQDAEANKEEDEKRKALVDAKNQADALVHQTEKTIKEMGEKLDEATKTKLQGAVDDIKEALKDENVTKETLDAKIEALNAVSKEMYEAQAKAEQAGAGCNTGNCGTQEKKKKDDDDIIDAEVE